MAHPSYPPHTAYPSYPSHAAYAPPAHPAHGAADIARKVFVRGLNYSTTRDGLIRHFSAYGQVVDASVIMDKQTNQSRGYGFVTFADPMQAAAVLGRPEQMIDGRKV